MMHCDFYDGFTKNKIQGVFFDLDGVLVDACDWHFISLNNALKDFNIEQIRYDKHLEKYNGLPTHIKLKLLDIKEEIAVKIAQAKQKYTLEVIRSNAKIDEHKIELLKFLRKNEVKICCVTNSIRETATEMLRMTGQLEYIDLLITNEDVANNKPAPDCYNLALHTLRLDGNMCVCVEDSPKGLQAALTSKIKNIWRVQNSGQVTLLNFMDFVKCKFII